MSEKQPEFWMRGPVEGVIPELQPVAHALLQARDEVHEMMLGFPEEKLWLKPGGMASVGFHMQHLRGVLDRLFTYARNELLTEEKLAALKVEGVASEISIEELLCAFSAQVDLSIAQVKDTSSTDLLLPRGIGRKQIPTNVIGLLFHAAEHTMRHTGQLLVTVRWVKAT